METKTNLKELQERAFDLHSEIIATPHLPTRRKLMQKRGKILTEIRILEAERDVDREKTAKKDLDELLTKTKPLLSVSINREKQQITEKLTVELTFQPCGHKRTLKLKELLRSFEFHQNKRVPTSEERLLTTWKLLFEMNSTAQGTRNCRKCQADKKSLRAKFGRWNPTEFVGTCSFSVGKMHA